MGFGVTKRILDSLFGMPFSSQLNALM